MINRKMSVIKTAAAAALIAVAVATSVNASVLRFQNDMLRSSHHGLVVHGGPAPIDPAHLANSKWFEEDEDDVEQAFCISGQMNRLKKCDKLPDADKKAVCKEKIREEIRRLNEARRAPRVAVLEEDEEGEKALLRETLQKRLVCSHMRLPQERARCKAQLEKKIGARPIVFEEDEEATNSSKLYHPSGNQRKLASCARRRDPAERAACKARVLEKIRQLGDPWLL